MEDDGESLEETGENVKNFFVYKLNFESVPEIEHAHFTGCPRRQDGTPSQERLCANSSATKRRIPFLRQQGE